MRSIWKGSVSFGLVNVPVKLYGATEEHDIVAHQVHSADGGRIRYAKICEGCGEKVHAADIAKQYEHEEHTVILTEDELAEVAAETDRTIEVLEFVPAEDLDTMLFDKPYYLAPEKGADKAYLLLATTLARTERVALVQFAMRGKTRLAALRVVGKENVIVAQTLRWPDEIRTPDWITVKDVKMTDDELDMAEQLVDTLANEFNADRYRDTAQEELRDLIASKAGDPLPEAEGAEEVSDLLEKLKASAAAKKAPRKKAS